ncbi:MAG TPA: addiction module protein [Flavobacteriaceae bacterium]|nr:addiction module protein [Flavobacteriaceae bacterium]
MKTTSDLRDKVQKYVRSADKQLLQLMESIAEDYIAKKEAETSITDAQKRELNNRLSRYKKGKTTLFTWEEVEEKLKQTE